MAEWKKYEGTQEQIDEMRNAKNGWIARYKNAFFVSIEETDILYGKPIPNNTYEEYLICEPIDPHAKMRKRHEMTGQPVYWQNPDNGKWSVLTEPSWNRNDVYSFNHPKEEKKFIEVREYVLKESDGQFRVSVIENNKFFNHPEYFEGLNNFVKWVDLDWRKVEI